MTESDVDHLPPSVRRYLRFMGVVGQSPTGSFVAHLAGRFRRSERESWMSADAWQHSSALMVTRLFRMKLMFAGRIPMTG